MSLFFAGTTARPQFLDASFGANGKAGPFDNGFLPAAVGGKIQSAQSMTVDNSGKIWIAGYKSNGTNQDFAVMRLNPDGTPDASFGDNGVQKYNDLLDNGNSDEYATVIAFRAPENTCILAGYRIRTVNDVPYSDIVVMQLNADGSVDNSFGQQGVRIIDEDGFEEVYSIAFSNGSGTNGIFLGGFTNPDFIDFNPGRGRIYRLNNTGGSVSSKIIDYAGAPCHVYSLAIDANGNILAGGVNEGVGSRFVVARLLPNESFDNSFDGDGIAFVNVGNIPSGVTQIKLQPDGKILLAGDFFNQSTMSEGTVVARLNNDGSVDNTFSGGYRIIPFNYTRDLSASRSLALMGDGKIIASGLVNGSTATDTDFGFARLNADGSLDNSFGTNGIYSFGFPGGADDVNNTLLLQDDGKLLAGTMSRVGNGYLFTAALARLQFTAPFGCSITGPGELCNGGLGTFSGPDGSYTYEWSITGNGSFPDGTATDAPTIQVRAGGGGINTFTLTLTLTNSVGDQATCSKTVTVSQKVCDITAPAQVCANVPAIFNGQPGMISYFWTIEGSGTIDGPNDGPSVIVKSGGGTYTLSLRTTGAECIYLCQKEVSVPPPPICAITGPSSTNPWSTGNVYAGPPGMDTYSWSISGNGSIIGSATGSSVNVTAGGSGGYTLTLVTTLGGCTSISCLFPVSLNPVVSACTYTQDFYSKRNNKGCSSGTTVSVTQLMLNAFGTSNTMVFGSAATQRLFTLYRSDISSGNIFKMLPGFDGSNALIEDVVPPLEGASYGDKASWYLVPIPTNGMQKGKIGNQLLSQLIVLWFNLANNPALGSIPLTNNVLITEAQTSCGTITPAGDPQSFKVHPDVAAYLNMPNSYTKDVNGLFQLANDVLGGLVGSILDPIATKDAVEAINNAFNGCRVLTGTYSSTQGAITTRTGESLRQELQAVSNLSVTPFPNPYAGKFNLRVATPVNGMATIEFYTVNGAKVYELKKQVITGVDNLVPYTGPRPAGNLLFRVRVGSYTASGFVVRLD